jgi:effector-binding domain-containing protein
MEDLPKLFAEYMPKAGMHAMNTLKYGEFTPAAVYKSWDEEKGETEFYIGLLLNKDLAPAEGMTALDLPAGKTLMLSKFGPYGEGDYQAHTSVYDYMKKNNLTQKEVIWELYVNDPTTVKPIEVQTDIYYPVN